jgi:hypothetical protein
VPLRTCDVATLHIELSEKDVGVGFVADGDEYAGEIDTSSCRAVDGCAGACP